MSWFSHSGDLGDIIYALPAIRGAGGGELFLYNDLTKTTHPMTRQRMELIGPLLRLQPYIRSVGFWEAREAKEHPLNRWRQYAGGQTIADMHLLAVGQSPSQRDSGWIQVDRACGDRSILFSRSSRYHNPAFPWKRVWQRYRFHAAFVGLQAEHEQFCRDVGEIPYLPTADLLELARYVAGCLLFVGNQSAPYAIAEGLKIRAILEVSPKFPNCCFAREGVIHGRTGTFALPELTELGGQVVRSVAE